MNSFYSIEDVYHIPLQSIIEFIRSRYPPDVHFYATEAQLRYLTIYFLDQEGLLSPHDSYVFHQPYFGQLYAASGGNTLAATSHFFFDMIPGIDYLSIL
jgi:hypothetical protein